MKKIISFEKKIEFPSMIGEVTSISLDHNLKFIDNYNISGNLILSGTYKLTEASRIEDDFYYELPTEIILTEPLEYESAKIEIDDFFYEIENDYNVICYIDVRVEGLEVVDIIEEEKLPELKEVVIKPEQIETSTERECDSDIMPEKPIEEMEEIKLMPQESNHVENILENINDTEETYSTYSVYILREEETIASLIEKYKTTKEELENYNDLTNLNIGSKIIIPLREN